MSLSRLPLSYCTNVHPGRSLAELEAGLDRYTVHVRDRLAAPLAAGLWLAESVVREMLGQSDGVARFAERLAGRGLTCHTLNAFPFGDFHGERVKEQVYLPDWSDARRRRYTEDCASILASLLPAGVDGSISTVPLGFKGFTHPADFVERCAGELIACSRELARVRSETGRTIRLAIEPEPLCVLETTSEAIEFFALLRRIADAQGAGEIVRTHLGLCYDVCHQAVEFEDITASIRELDGADVRINKLHISSALEIDSPMENQAGREALRQYIEPRYLHQTLARGSDGRVARAVDLNEGMLARPEAAFASAAAWRIHFHVPVNAQGLGPLSTTRPALIEALGAVAKLRYAPHLEVETYTWEVLPGSEKVDLVEGLTRELSSAAELLAGIGIQA